MAENTKCCKLREGLLTALVLVPAVLILCAFGKVVLTANQPRAANHTGSRFTPSLRLVIVISRHGSGGRGVTYPLFELPAHTFQYNWNDRPEDLSARGHTQMFRLGERVRSMYDGFIGQVHNPEEFKAFSSGVDITVKSAQVFLVGLFPPEDIEKWYRDPLWVYPPISTSDKDHLEFFQTLDDSEATKCPRFHEAQEEAVTRFIQENGANISQLVESVQPFTGLKPSADSNYRALTILWDSLNSLAIKKLPMPSWAEEIYPEPLTRLLSGFDKAKTVGSDVNARLLSGYLFKEITGYIKSKVTGSLEPNRKMFYYSGHDSTIWGLKTILGLDDEVLETIATGSALILELHQDNRTIDYNIQVMYLDGSSSDLEARPVVIPGCDSPCHFRQLVNITRRFGDLKDFDTECRLSGR